MYTGVQVIFLEQQQSRLRKLRSEVGSSDNKAKGKTNKNAKKKGAKKGKREKKQQELDEDAAMV